MDLLYLISEDEIHYTLDSSVPDESSPVFSEPIEIEGSMTVKARSYGDGEPSPVAQLNIGKQEEVINPLPVPSCTFIRVSETTGRIVIANDTSYPSGTTISINDVSYPLAHMIDFPITAEGVDVIVYAEYDGSEPYENASGTTMGHIDAWEEPIQKCANPVISQSENTVTITCSTPDATIMYRLGSSGDYAQYTAPFEIDSTVTVYAYATASGYEQSDEVSQECTYTEPETPKLLAPTVIPIGNNQFEISNPNSVGTIMYRIGESGSYQAYSSAVSITATSTVYAYVTYEGYEDSEITQYTVEYVAPPKLPTPVVTQGDGNHSDSLGNYAIMIFVNGNEYAHLRTTLKMIIDKTYMDEYLDLMGLGSSASSLETDESGNYIFNVSEMGENFLTANSNFGTYIIAESEASTFRVKFRNDNYEDSEWGSCTYQMMKLKTPTLSLTRSNQTVNGTVGNREGLATYRYKVGSAPTSETDGSAVASNGTFSFTNEHAITVYVRGFKAGYTMSDAVLDSINAYVPPKLPTPEPQFVDVNISGKWFSYYMDNIADYPSDTTFSIRVEDMDGGLILTTSTTKSALDTGPHEVHDSRIYDHPWHEDQGNGIVIVARASASGYTDSSYGRTPVWNLDAVFPAPSDSYWGWLLVYATVFEFEDIKETPSHLNVEIVDCSFNESVITIESLDTSGHLVIRCGFFNKDIPSEEPPFTDYSNENITNYIRGESLSVKVSTAKMPPRTIEFTFSDSNLGSTE